MLAVGISLSSQKSDEDEDNDVVSDVTWVFDDWISDQEDGSDILEAVWGEEESNTSRYIAMPNADDVDVVVQQMKRVQKKLQNLFAVKPLFSNPFEWWF